MVIFRMENFADYPYAFMKILEDRQMQFPDFARLKVSPRQTTKISK
jgi:hypothetical protein